MSSRSAALLVVLFLALAGAAAFAVLGIGTAEDGGAVVAELDGPAAPAEPTGAEGSGVAGGEAVVVPPRLDAGPEPVAPTSVLWPLVVELDLIEPQYLPRDSGGERPGAGRRARLAGQIAGPRGEPVDARIEFVAGANQGRVLLCDSSGRFGANDLYPGLAIVEVRGPGIIGSRREILLRQNTEFLLNIGYGRPGAVQGEVIDPAGEPIAGATVWIDGQRTSTNEEGVFYKGGLASDRALLEIEADGYAGVREVVGITADFTIPLGRLRYRLEKGCDLEVAVRPAIGANEKARVVVLPADTKQQRVFPWYRANPTEVTPGGTVRIEDLPAGPVSVRVFHRGTVANPSERVVNLRAGDLNRVEIDLEPAPLVRGRVVEDGEPVPGARVRLEAPDRVRATLAYFKTAHWFLESEVLPPFPFAVQEAVTDSDGRFELTAWSDVTETRYLEAWSPDRTAWCGKLIGPGDLDVVLPLEPADHGRGELVIEMPGRTQGLDVELSVSGTPAEPLTLAPDRALVVDDILAGTWRVRVSWYDQVLLEERSLDVDGTATLEVTLPEEAIVGQDRETWERAGREFPAAQ